MPSLRVFANSLTVIAALALGACGNDSTAFIPKTTPAPPPVTTAQPTPAVENAELEQEARILASEMASVDLDTGAVLIVDMLVRCTEDVPQVRVFYRSHDVNELTFRTFATGGEAQTLISYMVPTTSDKVVLNTGWIGLKNIRMSTLKSDLGGIQAEVELVATSPAHGSSYDHRSVTITREQCLMS